MQITDDWLESIHGSLRNNRKQRQSYLVLEAISSTIAPFQIGDGEPLLAI